MIKNKLDFLFILLILVLPISASSLPNGDSDSDMRGIERTVRKDGCWDWGTGGHGSYDNAILVFSAEKDLSFYSNKQAKFRVFTRGTKNYVEMSLVYGGIYTYTTLASEADVALNSPKQTQSALSADDKAATGKIDRPESKWEWGTFNLGSFDHTSQVLHKENDIVTYNVGKTKYRMFTSGTLNFVEVNYGFPGGIYSYTTKASAKSQ